MNVKEVFENLELSVKTEGDLLREVKGCYISDLLSDVMANSKDGDIWITLQTHPNIVAVATLKNIAAIIITNNRSPEEETLKKASEEGVIIATTPLSTFEIGGRLYNILRC
ncbi:MAG: DRTGG domain-containing protein [Thermodesulfovibrionales bacterium]